MKKIAILFMTVCIMMTVFSACKKETTLESIAVTTQPNNKKYFVGEDFDPTGMVVTATYSDKTTKPIAVTEVMLNYDFKTSGTNKIVTIIYEGKTTTVTGITVNSNFTGTGTSDKPFEIGTPEQLAKLAEMINMGHANYKDKYYKLTSDIDLSDYGASFNEGKGWIPIGKREEYSAYGFYGHFDGNNHKVSGLYINDSDLDYAGLFGRISGEGTVKNLGVDGEITGGNSVGGIAGGSSGSITNCYATVTVSGKDMDIGGVVGYVDGNMTNCYAAGAVSGDKYVGGVTGTVSGSVTNCHATGAVSGDNTVGGVAGWVLWGGSVNNCYSTGAVSGDMIVGGVAGFVTAFDIYNYGIVTNCYSTGAISGNSDVGGVAGWVFSFGRVTNCYSTGAISGDNAAGGVVGRLSGSIKNCYATGTVSGISGVGGMVGAFVQSYDGSGVVVNSGSITDCAALNQNIVRNVSSLETDFFHRIIGGANSGIPSNNVAWDGMQALGGITFGVGAHYNLDGADITAAEAKTAAFWTTTTATWEGWDTTVWDIANGRLPILRNVGGNQTDNNPPEHL